jgi:hypothetical protein
MKQSAILDMDAVTTTNLQRKQLHVTACDGFTLDDINPGPVDDKRGLLRLSVKASRTLLELQVAAKIYIEREDSASI